MEVPAAEAPPPEKVAPSRGIRFSATGRALPICDIAYEGGSSFQGSLLQVTGGGLLGKEYSKSHLDAFVSLTLLPIFRNQGYLGVSEPGISAALHQEKSCDGVRLLISFDPGVTYRLEGYAWSGDLLFSEVTMNSSMKTRKGDLVNEGVVRKDIEALLESYGQVGYPTSSYTLNRRLDKESRQAIYDIEIKQGPVHYMGELSLQGVTSRMEDQAHSKWKLKPGDVYDSSYPETFMKSMFGKKMSYSVGLKYRKSEDGKILVDVSLRQLFTPDT